ncbi:G-protein coupled receptor Mth2-like isoform X3 [Harmonia axyridis]|uniref:G-protein coupled receptor Mth2-like isoform X3 n=1 Tax=Harmonia axyridis TaxID=115357 RepID=UPI001E279CC4|nr:G-protein coupled receptor Mth2-like isoform X3 [Harmonia axyridis]
MKISVGCCAYLILCGLSLANTTSLDLCHVEPHLLKFGQFYLYKNYPPRLCGDCDTRTCFRKCCAHGFSIGKAHCIGGGMLGNFSIAIFEGVSYLGEYRGDAWIVGTMADCDFFPLVPSSTDSSDEFYVQRNGSLWVPRFQRDYSRNQYCVDSMENGTKVALVCFPDKKPHITMEIAGMVISMPFLLITFIVYALLPDRNLHMKALMCYVINLLLAYMFIVTIQLSDTVFPDDICAILGFGCIFFFLSSFFWMNVICIDIFLGFRGIRGGPGIRSSEWKRFLIYCIYAWGMSLLIVFITFMINTYVNPISIFHPGVAIGQCFIRDGLPMLLYFYGPMGILIISNVLLFALTALRIRKVKKDTAMLKHSGSKRHSDDEQQNFNLYFKLLLAMGVNWSMEIISWAVTLPQYFWYLSDICNALYGVIIFFIFVFKRNIWKQLKRRYYSFMGRHHMAHSMGTTNFTKTTNDSMTVSTNDRAMEESELNTSRMN